MISKQIRGHTLIPSLLRPGRTIIDAGSHRGEFATEVAQRFDVNVIALEPNESLWYSNPFNSNIQFRAVALSSTSGTRDFYLSDARECSSLLESAPSQNSTISISTITLSDLITECSGEVDLLKLDIEGAECDVLLSASEKTLNSFRQITVEFHDFMYPELAPRVDKSIQRLCDLGFESIQMSKKTREDILFIRHDIARKLSFQIHVIRSFDKNVRGVGRILSRILAGKKNLG
ncbi:MAG: FkbM family methyltransferase [Pirellula sp.]